VSFDIDGTLGEYHLHFTRFAEGFLGRPLPQGYHGGEFSDFLQLDKQTYRLIKLAYRQGGMKRSMPPYFGMIDLVQEARKRDCEIWLNTTRPYLRLDNIDPDTRFWLERFDVPYDTLSYDEDKYQVMAQNVDPKRVIMIVDDLAEQVQAAQAAFLSAEYAPMLVNRAHNYSDGVNYMRHTETDLWGSLNARLERWAKMTAA
jgi:hypothetical protein